MTMRPSLPASGKLPGSFWHFVTLSWLHMLWVTAPYVGDGNPDLALDLATAFHLLVWLTYSLAYLMPAIIPTVLAFRWLRKMPIAIAAVAVLTSSLCIIFIRVDSVIFDLYRFHFNGFVWNLLVTPGGIESLGGEANSYRAATMIAVGHLLGQILLWSLSVWLSSKRVPMIGRRAVFIALVLAVLGNCVIFGVADVRNDGRILNAAQTYPYFQRVTFRSTAARLGISAAPRPDRMALAVTDSRLRYPAGEVAFSPVPHPPNVVIFVAESLRWDRMTDAIMPNVWRLAQRGQYFKQHYSSGNGTREGLFGMFYGLYGSYWKSFLHAQQSPLLMDRFQELGYQFDLRTSAMFSYPEFDRTIFAKLPVSELHEGDHALPPWERDQQNATALIDFLRKRDEARPFMSFFFLESTHARYTFPQSSVIARPCLEDFNYASVTRESLTPKIDQLLNRYTNAAHWVDAQIGRVLAEMEQQGALDNTIVIVTGDHGEEFMEKGAWGHNSSFVEEQTHTPLVMSLPGMGHQTIEALTSHMDIGTTLLQQLGAPRDTKNYSSGRNLFDASPRDFVVGSDWHSVAVISSGMKYRIAYANRGIEQWAPTNGQDAPYSGEAASSVLEENRRIILEAIKETSRFTDSNRSAPRPQRFQAYLGG